MMKFAIFVSLLLAMAIGPCLANASGEDSTKYVEAMEAVLAEDSRLGAIRNESTRTQPIARVIEVYVAGLDAIDLGHCPPEFASALRRHRDAWHDSIRFFQGYGAFRGELHDVFEMIREHDVSAREGLEKAEAAIWSTWEDVEKASNMR